MKLKPTQNLLNRPDFEHCCDEAARLSVLIKDLEAARDFEIQAAQDRYNPTIAAHKDQLAAELLAAERYALAHAAELFTGKKKQGTTDLAHFGLRTTTPKLTIQGKRTEDQAIAEITAANRQDDFVKVKLTLDKPAIKKAWDAADTLVRRLFNLSQKETFWVEPKTDTAEGK
jgi:phage host-nuclease inhibitor protein Gam